MADFVRIKDCIVNLETLAYIRVRETYIDLGFASSVEKPGDKNYVRLERGTDLHDEEFGYLREFLLGLPEPDRVIIV